MIFFTYTHAKENQEDNQHTESNRNDMSFVPVRGIDGNPTLIIISERYTNIKWHASLIQVLRMHYNLSFRYFDEL